MKKIFFSLSAVYFLAGCRSAADNKEAEAVKAINQAEKAFADMAATKGIAAAFHFYADSAAVIKRGGDTLVRGKEGIRNFYNAPQYASARVSWAPDFTAASAAGDMGYTYGRYTWQFTDSSGKTTEYKGVFHTVWKKQPDGTWKYVWD